VDIDPRWKPDIVDDIRKLGTIPDSSCDEIYCSHTLEHLLESEVLPVPNIRWAAQALVSGRHSDEEILERLIGADQEATPFMLHKTMFWPRRLKSLLKDAGYSRVRILKDDFDLEIEAFKS